MFPNLFFLIQNENVRAWTGPYNFSVSGCALIDVQTCTLAQEASPSFPVHWDSGSTFQAEVNVSSSPVFRRRCPTNRGCCGPHASCALTESSSVLSCSTYNPVQEGLYLCFGKCSWWCRYVECCVTCTGSVKDAEGKSDYGHRRTEWGKLAASGMWELIL